MEESGTLIAGEERIGIRFTRGTTGGRVRPEEAKDFAALVGFFSRDDAVELVSRAGDWRAQVHIWEPDDLRSSRGSFRYTVQGVPMTSPK